MPKQLIDIFLSAKAQEAASSKSFRVGVRNATKEDPAELVLYGEIGDSWEAMDAASVGRFLRANKGKAVNVRINSPGGLAYDGITIHNALLQHDGKVMTVIEGMAGSAASIVAMAGSPVQMYENASLFIHRASVVAIGNSDVMDEAKGWLDKIDEAIARTYKAKTGKSMEKINSQMKGKVDGTVFTAAEALKDKYIDEVLPLKQGEKAKASAESKPSNCTCNYPAEKFRNGSCHRDDCPCHKEWEDAGGFNRKLREEAEQRLRLVASMTPAMIAAAKRQDSRRTAFARAGGK